MRKGASPAIAHAAIIEAVAETIVTLTRRQGSEFETAIGTLKVLAERPKMAQK
jgi:hypothetical protein